MLSVIIATHNGEATLGRTLDALARVDAPSGELEILIVDNASTDATPEILRRYLPVLPLRILVEPRKGKSFALNRAMSEARGALLLFADDDVIPAAGWITAFEAAAETHKDVAVFAGQVRHEWEVPPPRWLEDLANAGRSYGGTPIGRGEEYIKPSGLKGANFMVRREAIGPVRFAEDDGVNFTGQGQSAGGEDTRFAREITDRGGRILFVPGACVRHIVRAHQVGLVPVFQRYLRIGGTKPIRAEGAWVLFGYPVRSTWRLIALGSRCVFCLLRGRPSDAAKRMVSLASLLGSIRAWRRVSRRDTAPIRR